MIMVYHCGFNNKDSSDLNFNDSSSDSNYVSDYGAMVSGGTNLSGDRYWLASRRYWKYKGISRYLVEIVREDGIKYNYNMAGGAITIYSSDSKNTLYSAGEAIGVRTVFLINPNAKLTGSGDNLGSEINPYRLIQSNE